MDLNNGHNNLSTHCLAENQIQNELEIRKIKHRDAERNRYRQIPQLIRQLNDMLPPTGEMNTQASTLKKSARYILFLNSVIKNIMDTNHGNGNTNSSSSNDDSLIKLLDQHTNAFESIESLTTI